MSVGRQRLLLTAWAVLTFGLAVRALARGVLGDRVEPTVTIAPVTIDVDRAGVHELTTLPGIGIVRAEAIVLARVRHGPFRGWAGLDRVDGLGPEIVAGLRPFVLCARDR